MSESVLHTYLENSACESNNILHILFSILMENRTKLTMLAFVVVGIIAGATIGSIPSVVFAQGADNSTSSAGGGASSSNSTSGGSANSTGTTGSNSTSG
jgi:hypothetical protein